MYIAIQIHNECPHCGKTFAWSEGKNKTFYFSSRLNCPGCGVRLRNPQSVTESLDVPQNHNSYGALFLATTLARLSSRIRKTSEFHAFGGRFHMVDNEVFRGKKPDNKAGNRT